MTKIEDLINVVFTFARSQSSVSVSAWLRHQFVAPVFADPEKTRQARLTHIMIQVSFIVVVLLCVVAFVDYSSPVSALLFRVYTAIGSLLVVGFVLSRWGFIHFANQMLNLGILFIFTYEAIFVDTDIRSVGYGLLYLAVIHAGIMLGCRARFWNAGIIILLGITLQYAKRWGLLPQ